MTSPHTTDTPARLAESSSPARIRTQFGSGLFDGPTGPDNHPDIQAPVPVISTPTEFDYTKIAPDLVDEARATAERIRMRSLKMQGLYIETGRDLIRIKAKLPHGDFGAWIEAEFQWTEKTAQNYMNAATFLEGKSETVSLLPPAIVYALAAPSAPAEVVTKLVAAVDAGARITASEVREKLSTALAAQRRAELVKSPEDIKRERENEKRRRAREAEHRRKLEEEQAASDARRDAGAKKAAEHLYQQLGAQGVIELFKLLHGTDWYRVERCFRAHSFSNVEDQTAATIDAKFGGGAA
jgi:hypothetical protein